jgi:hypothetical protein
MSMIFVPHKKHTCGPHGLLQGREREREREREKWVAVRDTTMGGEKRIYLRSGRFPGSARSFFW